MENVGMASPWVVYTRKVEALFEHDPEVIVDYVDEPPKLTLLVANQSKAYALARLLGDGRQFGNVALKIEVIPANEDESAAGLFLRALSGNAAFCEIQQVSDPGMFDATYVMLAPECVQFATDSLQSPYGLSTMTYEDLASDVFNVPTGTFFASDVM